ncbi:dual OB domain-containing protein [Massilia sp. SYSU DXS3249]
MLSTIVILANSIKHRLRCVAGKPVNGGRWIRLVANPEGGAVTTDQASYTNPHGRFVAKPLQKIIMRLGSPVPLVNQPENVLCGAGWVQKYKIGMADLPTYQDHPESLWGEGNRISAVAITSGACQIDQSLYLVKVEDLTLYRSDENKRRVTFRYNNVDYDLPATCTNFDTIEIGRANHDNWVVASLGEEHSDGFHYKIIATIL